MPFNSEIKVITSLQNASLKEALKLQESRHRRKQQRFLVEGSREIERALRSRFEVLGVYFAPELLSPSAKDVLEGLQNSAPAHCQWYQLDAKCLNRLLVRKDHDGLVVAFAAKSHELGLLAKAAPKQEAPFYLLIDGVEKPGNLGALLRSADGAGVQAVIILTENYDLYHPHVIRASLGCLFSLPIVLANYNEAWTHLKSQAITVYGAALHAQSRSYYECEFTGPTALVLGSEAQGLDPFWLSHNEALIQLPMLGMADSLNVAAAGSILMYEVRRQRLCTKMAAK